ncbi:hypothetical protein DDI_1323 [Dickeya dianthicola RNS04.9]|nr:hypothetical protein DDI_1323 [Dickeya dianthicola RNS04.9]
MSGKAAYKFVTNYGKFASVALQISVLSLPLLIFYLHRELVINTPQTSSPLRLDDAVFWVRFTSRFPE